MNLSVRDEEVIHYWFLYLKEHSGYKECCDAGGSGEYSKLYADFGNVHALTFKEWFDPRELLFTPCDPFTLEVVKDISHFDDGCLADDDTLFIQVNRYATKDDLRNAFDQLLKDYPQLEQRTRDDTAEYPIASKMASGTLRIALLVHQRIKDSGDLLAVAIQLAEEGEAFIKPYVWPDLDERGAEEEIRRFSKIAERLIRNVAATISYKLSQFPLNK